MKIIDRLLCAALALALCLSLAACEKEEEPSSSQIEESSLVSAQVSPAPSEEPESLTEGESSSFVPAEDLIPSEDPAPGSFEEAFSQNVIDKAYDADYANASSFSMLRQACDTAARRWKNMVTTALDAAVAAVSESEAGQLLADQAQWEETAETRIQLIREDAGDSNEGILSAAREIVLLYRDRAKELCRIKYEADGKLPAFPDVSAEAAG